MQHQIYFKFHFYLVLITASNFKYYSYPEEINHYNKCNILFLDLYKIR